MKEKNTYASPYVKLVVLDQTDVLATFSGRETNDIIFNDDYKDGWGD
jgi:hypothetical protein